MSSAHKLFNQLYKLSAFCVDKIEDGETNSIHFQKIHDSIATIISEHLSECNLCRGMGLVRNNQNEKSFGICPLCYGECYMFTPFIPHQDLSPYQRSIICSDDPDDEFEDSNYSDNQSQHSDDRYWSSEP